MLQRIRGGGSDSILHHRDDPRGTADHMLNRARTTLPHRLMNHLRAPLAGVPAIMPAIVPVLRAYSGIRVPDRSVMRTADVLGRLGALEVRLARGAADVRRA